MSSVSNVLNNVNAIKKNKSYPALSKNKGVMMGSLIGMAGGFLVALSKGKNALTYGFLGAIAGGGIAQIYLSYTNKTDEQDD